MSKAYCLIVFIGLTLFLPSIAAASKPSIPWQLAATVEQLPDGNVKLRIQMESRRNAKNIGIEVDAKNADLIDGKRQWRVDLKGGDKYVAELMYKVVNDKELAGPWTIRAKQDLGSVNMSRVVHAQLGNAPVKEKPRKPVFEIRRGAQEMRVE